MHAFCFTIYNVPCLPCTRTHMYITCVRVFTIEGYVFMCTKCDVRLSTSALDYIPEGQRLSVQIYACSCTCACMYTEQCVCMCVYNCESVYSCDSVCMCMWLCVHVHACMHEFHFFFVIYQVFTQIHHPTLHTCTHMGVCAYVRVGGCICGLKKKLIYWNIHVNTIYNNMSVL